MKKLIILVLALTTSLSMGMSEPTTINSVSEIKWTVTTKIDKEEVSDDNFKEAFKQILKWEGGYANDPHDSGGETYCGISRVSHPSWSGWKVIDTHKMKWNQKLPELQGQVYYFYKQKYWKGLKLDKINDLRLSNELFDISVNMGKRNAYNFLKTALNKLSYTDFTSKDDIESVIEYVNTKDSRFIESLTKLINGYQLNRYLEIVNRYPNKRRYLKVWLLRC